MRRVTAVAVLLSGCGAATVVPTEPVEEEEPPPPIAIALRFVEAPDDPDTQTPQTRILLVRIDPERGRSTDDVGTYQGACNPAETGEGELLHARCWWAGAGVELDVRRDGDALVVHRVDTDEQAPPSARREVARVELPPDADVEPLGSPALPVPD